MKKYQLEGSIIDMMLQVLVERTTAYQSDFHKYDKETLMEDTKVGDTYIWHCRNHGTHLWQTKNLLLEGNVSRDSAHYWSELRKSVTFFVEITSMEDGSPCGLMTSVDLAEVVIQGNELVQPSIVGVEYEDGFRAESSYNPKETKNWERSHGKCVGFHMEPKDEDAMKYALKEFGNCLKKGAKVASMEQYIKALKAKMVLDRTAA